MAGPDSITDYPEDRLNPDGSPWGPPPDPAAEAEMVPTVWGVALVFTRGYPGVSLHAIEDVLYEAAKVCEPEPGQFQLQIHIEPELFKIDEQWSAGATEEPNIWVVGHYEAWDGRIAHYDEMLFQELVRHVLDCEPKED
jgi:hypothetical protein